MNGMWSRFIPAFFCTLCFGFLSSGISGDSFPDRPVKVIVPFSPGGGSDTFARIMQRSIQQHDLLGEKLVIVNIPGAGGTIGSRTAMNAYPDGHTILFLHDGILTAQKSGLVPFGREAFEPIAITGEVGAVIAVGESSEYRKLETLLQAASTKTQTITFAANIGAPSHYMALILQQAHGSASFRFVQSGGGAKRFGELKGGHIGVSAFSVAEYLSFKDGGLLAIAYLGEKRHPALPDVPTARENGVDAVYGNLQGWWAPKGTPKEATEKIARVLGEAMETPEIQKKLDELQIDPVFLTAQDLEDALEKRENQLAEVAPVSNPFQPPNVPLFFLIAGAIGLAGILIHRLRQRATTQEGQVFDSSLSIRIALAFLAVSLFPLVLSFTPFPFEAVTVLLFVAVAFFKWKGTAARRLISGLSFGIIMALVCRLFFTSLLGIELP